MNYRKSLLSLATVVALNSASALFADTNAAYVPLTTKDNDNRWIMFGVNAFSSGVSSVILTAPENFTPTYRSEDENVSDTLATKGFKDDDKSDDMAAFQALTDAKEKNYFKALSMALDSGSFAYSSTEAVRSMYISIAYGTGQTTPKIKLDYKASLEGSTGEIKFELADGSTDNKKYVFKLNQEATYANPEQAVPYSIPDDNASLQKRPEDTLAYNLTKSPVIPSSYSKEDYQAVNADSKVRFYHYNASLGQWELWDNSLVSSVGNDFTEFTKGQAYWGKFDVDGDKSSNAQTRAGLVLGKTALGKANASVYTNQLTEGWNHISFDPAKHRDIRRAITGLVVKYKDDENATIHIYNETLNNSVAVDLVKGDTVQVAAKRINAAVDSSKILGLVPKSFNVKVFDDNASGQLIFLSDKKFTLEDNATSRLDTAKTLAGRDPIENGTSSTLTSEITDKHKADSRYGEYALLVEAMVGEGTASNIDATDGNDSAAMQSAKIQFGTLAGDSVKNSVVTPLAFEDTDHDDKDTNLTSAASELGKDPIFEHADPEKHSGAITQIDSDFNGTNDMLLLASTKQFYLRDNTYVRSYVFTQPDINTSVTLDLGTPISIDVIDTNTSDDLNKSINALGETTGVFATAPDQTHLIVVSAQDRTFDIIDSKSTTDILKRDNTQHAAASYGAVKRVFDIAKLSRESIVYNKYEIDFSDMIKITSDDGSGAGTSDVNVTINGNVAAYENQLPVIDDTTDMSDDDQSKLLTMFKGIVATINDTLASNNIPAFAIHNYVKGSKTIVGSKITINGIDLNVSATEDDNGTSDDVLVNNVVDENNATDGLITIDNAKVTDDLKDEAIYAPDFANYGPLYTLKDAGFDVKSILRPDTNIATNTVTWAGVDVTRPSSEWFKDNEYNLFSVDNTSGYWAYLTAKNDTTITLDNVKTSFTNKYHFLNDGTTDNMKNGQIDIDLSGLDMDTSNVKLMVDGKDLKLTKETTGYSTKISTLETGLAKDSIVNIALRATDGKGNVLYNPTIATIDNQPPHKPVIDFTNGYTASFTPDSKDTDVASFYIYKDYVADKGGVPIETALSVANATTYNICAKADFSFGAHATTTEYNLLLLAVDGSGTFGKDNISDAVPFKYVNTIKGATVVSHTFGDDKSTVKAYDDVCNEKTTGVNDGGITIESLTAGTSRVSFISKGTKIDGTVDIPVTAFYKTSGDSGAVIKVSSLAAYADDYFFVQYGDKLYKGQFKNVADGDASFGAGNAIVLTAVDSKNQTLNP